jgi:hypothetical protein
MPDLTSDKTTFHLYGNLPCDVGVDLNSSSKGLEIFLLSFCWQSHVLCNSLSLHHLEKENTWIALKKRQKGEKKYGEGNDRPGGRTEIRAPEK